MFLRVKMKISFMAFQWKQTLSEFIMKTILNTYVALRAIGKIKNPYPDPKASKTIYGIIMGESDFKQYAIDNMKKISGVDIMDLECPQDTDRVGTE